MAGFDAERESALPAARRIRSSKSAPKARRLPRSCAGRRSSTRRRQPADVPQGELDKQIRKNRIRWLRANRLDPRGLRRARHLGWPNTYTFTKSLAESLIAALRAPACRSPSCGPPSWKAPRASPFSGWNEGINTSAPLSYLLGTYFRQLPTNERKCLDRHSRGHGLPRHDADRRRAGRQRRHARMYQLATSADQSLRHGPLHRTDRPGPPQALPRAGGHGALDPGARSTPSRSPRRATRGSPPRAEGRRLRPSIAPVPGFR